MSDSLRYTIERYNAAWNAHDLDAITVLHTPDMVPENHTAGQAAEGQPSASTSRRSSRPGPTSPSRRAASMSARTVLSAVWVLAPQSPRCWSPGGAKPSAVERRRVPVAAPPATAHRHGSMEGAAGSSATSDAGFRSCEQQAQGFGVLFPSEAVAQTPSRLCGAVLRVGSQNRHFIRLERGVRREAVEHGGSHVRFRERAAAFLTFLCATSHIRKQ